MPDISDFFQSNYIKSADLLNKPVTLIMNELQMIEFDDGEKPALSFHKTDKQMILNRTNANTIVKLYGSNTDTWKGKEITLITAQVMFRGSMVPAIRIKDEVPENPPIQPTNPEITDNDIPF